MSYYEYLKFYEVLCVLILGLYFDFKCYKIPNKLTFTATIIGLFTNLVFEGFTGFANSGLGIIAPIVLLFILYSLRMLGAGDVKMFSAIGAIMGLNFVLWSIAYSFIFGAIIGIIILVFRKAGRVRLLKFYIYMKTCFITLKLHEYEDFNNKDSAGLFRFSYGIVGGVLITYFFG